MSAGGTLKKFLFITGVFLLSALSCGAARSEAPIKKAAGDREWIASIRDTAAKLFEVETLAGKKITVGSFKDEDGNISEFSLLAAKHVYMAAASVAKERAFNAVAGDELSTAMKVWLIGARGLIDEDCAKQAGRLLGINVFCFGDYLLAGNSLKLNMRLIDAADGNIIAEASMDSRAEREVIDACRRHVRGRETAAKGVSEQDGIRLDIWSEKEEFKIGEKIRFFARTDKDCHLSLVHVDSSGNVSMIFPNDYSPSNFITAGETYSIPPENAHFSFVASEPAGYEIVRGIASKRASLVIEEVIGVKIDNMAAVVKTGQADENPFGSFLLSAPVGTRGINIDAAGTMKEEWSEAVIRIRIIP